MSFDTNLEMASMDGASAFDESRPPYVRVSDSCIESADFKPKGVNQFVYFDPEVANVRSIGFQKAWVLYRPYYDPCDESWISKSTKMDPMVYEMICTWVPAFSAGSRIINTYCASLASDTVQVLICGSDWCRSLHVLKIKSKNEKKHLEIILPAPT
ncbi:hypothetical protein ACS0TY_025359 [Phlomoides rotata]